MSISQRITNILNGVSQQPQALRPPSQATEQINGLSLTSRGVAKRPPTKHVAQLTSLPTGNSSYWIHRFKTPVSQYIVVVSGGDLKVFDENTGAECPVTFLTGKASLAGTDFRAATADEVTYILNRSTIVGKGTATAPAATPEALVYVRQVDYSTTYTITLGPLVVAQVPKGVYTTPDGTDPKARASITTDTVITELYNSLAASLASAGVSSQYQLTPLGSSLYIKSLNGQPVVVNATDGLGDQALKVIQGSVQSFDDLPERAPDGFRVEVVGDDTSDFDRFWVSYTAGANGATGVWKECPQPGIPLDLDQDSMPFKLTLGGEYISAAVGAKPADPVVQDSGVKSVTAGPTHTGTVPGPSDTNPSDGTTTALTLQQDTQTEQHGDFHQWSLDQIPGALTNTAGNTVTARFHVDTSVMDPGVRMKVSLLQLNGAGVAPTVLASNTYDAGKTLNDETLSGLTDLNGKPVVLQQEYSTEINQNFFRQGVLTVPGSGTDGGGGLTLSKPTTRDIVFVAATVYPEQYQYEVILDGTPHTYTVPAGGLTGTALATALQAFLAGVAGFTVTNPSNGVVTLQRTATADAPGIQVWPSFPATTAYLPSLAMVANEHNGRTVLNVTDGSEGVVSSNEAETLVVFNLAGGARNTFAPGDQVRILGTGVIFTYGPENWSQRAAGDLTTVPWPSFVGQQLREVFFHQGRLGFTWGQSIVLSQAGVLPNFFRQSAQHLLADDVIDVTNAHPKVVTFDSAVEWDGGLLLNGNDTQFKLSGQPALTPESVRLDLLSEYPVAPSVRPLVLGMPVLFARSRKGPFGHVSLYHKVYYTGIYEAEDVTTEIPTYIVGNPLELIGDPSIGFAAVLTDGSPGSLYVYTFEIQQQSGMTGPELERAMSSWSRWDFAGATILGINMLDGVIALVVQRSDGIFLETIDVLAAPSQAIVYADRQGHGTTEPYQLSYTPSLMFLRSQKGDPEMRGWLTLHYLDVEYVATTGLQVVVTPLGKATWTYATDGTLKDQGTLHVPIGAKNDRVTIVISSTDTGPCALTGFQWEGSFTTRSKRQ